jgi:hypothetical protein
VVWILGTKEAHKFNGFWDFFFYTKFNWKSSHSLFHQSRNHFRILLMRWGTMYDVFHLAPCRSHEWKIIHEHKLHLCAHLWNFGAWNLEWRWDFLCLDSRIIFARFQEWENCGCSFHRETLPSDLQCKIIHLCFAIWEILKGKSNLIIPGLAYVWNFMVLNSS